MERRYERCPNCMQGISEGEAVCHSCGFDIASYKEKPNCLRPFTVLENKYMIGRVIGMGGFGITYIGWDLNLQTYIAIKEYFPESLANRDTETDATKTVVEPKASAVEMYNKGLKRYVEEAQNISRFYNLKGIVSVKDFFYANDTAYIVMEYINGTNLKDYLKSCGGKIDEATLLNLMKPVFESLYQIHNSGLIHRDISPDNIMVDQSGDIKLIDFGSARGQAQESEKTYTVILKHGYAPSEQYYSKGNQGPWTDIYSLCATMYKMLTGNIPPNSVERMETDEYQTPTQLGVPCSPRTEAVLNKGLAVKVSDRYQNIGELLNDLYGNAPVNNVPGMPVAAAASYGTQTSLSQQSMHLSMQPQMAAATTTMVDESTRKKMLGLKIGIGVAIAAVIIALLAIIGVLSKDKDDDDKTTEVTSESTETTEIDPTKTTEATTEEPVDGGEYQYVWPTEMSDDWHDYMMNINGTIYQFPIPYTEWKKAGWSGKYVPELIDSGNLEYISYSNGELECQVLVVNPGLNQAPIENCFIIGVEFDGESNNIPSGTVIEIANGITYGVSTEDDIRKAFGAPDYYYQNSESGEVSIDYNGDEYEDGMDIELDASGVINSIRIGNTKLPDGVKGDASDISTEPPELNSKYVAPTSPSASREDMIFTIDGAYYQLPVPVSEFLKNGWKLDTATDDYISGSSYTSTYLEKDGSKISVNIQNFTSNAILPANGIITKIGVKYDYMKLDAQLPGGISINSTFDEVNAAFQDLGEDYEMDDSYTYTVYFDASYSNEKYSYMYLNATGDKERNVMESIAYSISLYNASDVY